MYQVKFMHCQYLQKQIDSLAIGEITKFEFANTVCRII